MALFPLTFCCGTAWKSGVRVPATGIYGDEGWMMKNLSRLRVGLLGLALLLAGALTPALAKESSEAKAGDAAESFASSRFVTLAPLAVSLFRDGRPLQPFVLSLRLEVVDVKAKILVKRMMPRLHDACLRHLQNYLWYRVKDPRRVDLVVLKRKLRAVSERVLGPGIVVAVLVRGVS
jgi:hypothetical protein